MPVITVKRLERETTTDAQREAVIAGITRVMVHGAGDAQKTRINDRDH